MSFSEDETWISCNWYSEGDTVNAVCEQRPAGQDVRKTRIIDSRNYCYYICTTRFLSRLTHQNFNSLFQDMLCIDRSDESKETFPDISGGKYNPNMCQLVIGHVNYNYTGNWTVEIIGGTDAQGNQTTKQDWIQITTTRTANVTGIDQSLSVSSGDRFETSCEASFGVPKPVG